MIDPDLLEMTDGDAGMTESHTVDVLEGAGELRGVIELVADEAYMFIENISVHPAQQGKGLGRQLLEHAETSARLLGYKEIRLYTHAGLASSLSFYAAHGYTELETTAIIPGSITVQMNKIL